MAAAVRVEVAGLLRDGRFQFAKGVAEGLKRNFPTAFEEPAVRPLLECDWQVYLTAKMLLRGEAWAFAAPVMCFADGSLVGDERELSRWALQSWGYKLHRPQALSLALAEDHYRTHLRETGHTFVFMDIEVSGETAGRLLFELFSDVCPETCRNFHALCTGEAGVSQSNVLLSYKGSLFHRVVPDGWVQGGDISPCARGNGGESIYGPTFADESFAVSHSKRGILGMANRGRHTNGSQFYITLAPALWMDRNYVAFGQLVEGTGVLKRLEEVPTFNERPKTDCRVIACGELQL
ncbi:putative inactive peptidyl-prolyl cis-trans isomerase-like 6 isoform X2 [Denticeps clupeoides]|uniref:putative inactive peptidyl-prolyl cis-trans isomerase-like 6 isoform X2 n=1 Tax=Denticeps clupeoides TaxID=299321 RepID=UPI0010A4ED27|nr:probable inactive peptidyl-prolyl cis-trans isomerase-like 6 isoform X2 [Denticeps clupeoides]